MNGENFPEIQEGDKIALVDCNEKPKIVTWEDWIRQLQCSKTILSVDKNEES